jgi:hypothetical protein
MATLTIHASGPASPAAAWERYAELGRWTEWAPQINSVAASAERIAPGVTGRVVGPVGVSATFVVDAVDEAARRWSWTVRRGPLRLRLQHGVRERPSGCTTWLTIDAPLPVALGYAPLARFALGRLVAR